MSGATSKPTPHPAWVQKIHADAERLGLDGEAIDAAIDGYTERACSSHDALVAALTMARAQVELRKEEALASHGMVSGFDAKLAEIDSALKTARGEA